MPSASPHVVAPLEVAMIRAVWPEWDLLLFAAEEFLKRRSWLPENLMPRGKSDVLIGRKSDINVLTKTARTK